MKRNLDFLKWLIPLVVLALVGVFAVLIVNTVMDPGVIEAKSMLSEKSVGELEARAELYRAMPDAFGAMTTFSAVLLVSGALFVFAFVVSVSLLLSNVNRFLASGVMYEKEANGQKVLIKVGQLQALPNIRVEKTASLPNGKRDEPKAALSGKSLLREGVPMGRPLRPEERRAPGRGVPIKEQSADPLTALETEVLSSK